MKMKKKFLSIFSFMLVISMCFSVYSPKVFADGESCEKYDAYLYFSDQQWISTITDNATNGVWNYETCTTAGSFDENTNTCKGSGTFEIDFTGLNLPSNATIKKVEESGSIVPLSSDADLTDFWNVMTTYSIGTTVKNKTLYVKHGAWTNKDSSNLNAYNGYFTADEYKKASYTGISSVKSATFTQNGTQLIGTFRVLRKYGTSEIGGMESSGKVVYRKNKDGNLVDKSGNVVDESSNDKVAIIFAPMLYKMQFEACTPVVNPVKNPTLTIRYWYDEVGKKKASDTYQEEKKAGSKYEVDSPKIEGWTPDKDVVRGTMPDEDLVIDVIYTPKTGGVAMGFVWFIGLLGLGYGIYYYNKTVRDEEEEI